MSSYTIVHYSTLCFISLCHVVLPPRRRGLGSSGPGHLALSHPDRQVIDGQSDPEGEAEPNDGNGKSLDPDIAADALPKHGHLLADFGSDVLGVGL